MKRVWISWSVAFAGLVIMLLMGASSAFSQEADAEVPAEESVEEVSEDAPAGDLSDVEVSEDALEVAPDDEESDGDVAEDLLEDDVSDVDVLEDPDIEPYDRPDARRSELDEDDTDDSRAPLTYTMRIREIEDRINELKDDVFRSRSRLFLLREQILQDRIGGSRIVIHHDDRTRSRYRVTGILYSLNGVPVYTASESGEMPSDTPITIHEGNIVSGPQNLSVQYTIVASRLGLFPYMDGYRFRMRSSYAVTVEEGQTIEVTVALRQDGGVNRPIDERLDVAYELELYDSLDRLGDDMAEGGPR